MHGVYDGIAQLKPHFDLVEIGRLGGPESRIGHLPSQVCFLVQGNILDGNNRNLDRFALRIEHAHLQRACRAT